MLAWSRTFLILLCIATLFGGAALTLLTPLPANAQPAPAPAQPAPAAPATPAAPAAAPAPAQQPQNQTGAFGGSPASSNTTNDQSTFMQRIVWSMVAGIFGTLVWITGGFLDWTIENLVLGFGSLFQGSGLGLAVNTLWGLVRDLFNLTFIFGLVFTGIRLIWDSESGAAKTALKNIVIAALLVNFSLFFTKAIIDFSNIAAVQVAQLIYTSGGTGTGGAPVSMSQSFANQMGLSSVWGSGGSSTLSVADQGRAPQGGWAYIFGAMMVMTVASFSFLAGAALIAIRFITLMYLMVLSPVMFLGNVFPKFKSESSDFWKKLLSSAFFAPAFMLMLYFALYTLTTFSGGFRGNIYGAFNSTSGSMVAISGFLVTCGFLVGAVIVAQKMSVMGAGKALEAGAALRNRAQRGVIGAGRGLARGTTGFAARGVGYGAEKLTSKLDRGLGQLGQRGAFSRALARTLDTTVGGGLRSAQGASILGSETVAARRKRVREQQARFNTSAQESGRGDAITNNFATARRPESTREERAVALNALGNQVRRMSNNEVLALAAAERETLMHPDFAQFLSDAHVTALRDSGILTNGEFRELGIQRNNGVFATIGESLDNTGATLEQLNTAIDQLTQTVQRLPIDRLQGLDIGTLANQRVAANLTEKQLEDLQNSGRFTAAEMQQIRDARTAGFTAIANGNAPEILRGGSPEIRNRFFTNRRERLMQGSSQDAGRLPAAVFSNPAMAQYITPAALQQRVRNGLSTEDVTNIQANIITYLTRPDTPDRVRRAWEKWSENTTEGSRFDFTVRGTAGY